VGYIVGGLGIRKAYRHTYAELQPAACLHDDGDSVLDDDKREIDVLLINNDLHSRRLIYAALKEAEIEVWSTETAAPGEELLRAISSFKPKIILLDTSDQPSESVNWLFENLRSSKHQFSLVLVTGIFDKARLPKPDINIHLLVRPVTISQVVRKIKGILEGS
jgi:DNA-binding NtrC family response regulator